MSGWSQSEQDEPISGINVTPLVDVVLVLLVIFMMTAPALYRSAIKIELPKAKTGETGKEVPISFALDAQGALHWGQETVTWEELDRRLSKLSPASLQETASISADSKTPHGTVVRLMDALRKSGLTRFALSVDGAQ